jgi:hypothetical protein
MLITGSRLLQYENIISDTTFDGALVALQSQPTQVIGIKSDVAPTAPHRPARRTPFAKRRNASIRVRSPILQPDVPVRQLQSPFQP